MDITSFILSILSWLAPLIVIGIIVLVIVSKVRSASQKYLGMSPSQAMELINKGVKEEATTPKGITALSEMYGPAITRDYPEIGYKGMEVKARNAIVAILNAIMNKNAESLKASEYTQDLINKVNNRITTLNANNETVAESQTTRTEARRQRQGLKFLSSMNMQRCRKKRQTAQSLRLCRQRTA